MIKRKKNKKKKEKTNRFKRLSRENVRAIRALFLYPFVQEVGPRRMGETRVVHEAPNENNY